MNIDHNFVILTRINEQAIFYLTSKHASYKKRREQPKYFIH